MALRSRPTLKTYLTVTTKPIKPLSSQIRRITLQQHTSYPKQDNRGQNSKLFTEFDRTILSPERAETAYSGTDNKVGDDHYAYDPTVTNPETEFKLFEDEVRVDGECDPLFISPANRDFSQTLDRDLDGRAILRDKGDRQGAAGSVRGWVNKHGTVQLRKGDGEQGSDYERMLRGLRRLQMNR
ncbi:hypothetical protein BJX63DRAFT_263881 [Aspergillus granulosus]|uniref:Uncharacterized protein n=1 Tax=Aspergillus granulosus TaxID=176169 RepID=A0ABR4H933_9EURO